MMTITRMLSTALVLLLSSGCFGNSGNSGSNSQVEWALENVVFEDGATASGSFVWDYDLDEDGEGSNPLSSFRIQTRGGDESIFPPTVYDSNGNSRSLISDREPPTYISFRNTCRVFDLFTPRPLTIEGGLVAFDTTGTGVPNEYPGSCLPGTGEEQPFRKIVSGAVRGN